MKKKIFLFFLILISLFLVASCSNTKQFKGKTMVCLGDSITSGFGIEHAYPERLKKELAFSREERNQLEASRSMPIVFDEDCPETTPEMALKFRRVNPIKRVFSN